ncbi:MAG: CapA family protein [bacterium]|nr:CapA family protein [bacterium]
MPSLKSDARLNAMRTPIILLLLGAATVATILLFRSNPPSLVEQDVPDRDASYVLLFVGDIILDRGVEHMVKTQGENSWMFPLAPVAEYLKEADFLFGNLESVISDKGHNVGSIYSFRAHPASMEALTTAGFDMVSVANNHSFDYTIEAFADSLKRLEGASILYTGGGFTNREARAPSLFSLPNGTTIGVVAYTTVGSPSWEATENRAGIAWIDEARLNQLREDIANTKKVADIVITSFHFGEEYQPAPSSFQRTIGETAIEAGADIVVGHHPHVLQPLEQYQNGWIAWSLGNFLFDQYFSQETMQGAILRVEVQDKNITSVNLVRTKQNEFYQVELAE